MKFGQANKKQFILGYDGKQSRLYLCDKTLTIHAHRLLLSVIEFQNAIMSKDLKTAQQLLSQVPKSQHSKLAKFLESNNQPQMAYQISQDANHKFELALQLNLIQDAFEIAEQQASPEKWKKVGDISLMKGQFSLAEQCYLKSDDFNSLLLFYSSYGDQEGLSKLAKRAEEAGKFNVAFEAAFVVADVDRCLNILIKAKRMGEAAMFAKAHSPSRLTEVTQQWAKLLQEQGLPF